MLVITIMLTLIAQFIAACSEPSDHETGVKLTVQYTQTPARLRVTGATRDGRFYGPNLLPELQRPLAMGQESVLVLLPASMHGAVLSFAVTGLDEQATPHTRGSVVTQVVGGKIQTVFVSLSPAAGCPRGTMPWTDGDCVPSRWLVPSSGTAGNGVEVGTAAPLVDGGSASDPPQGGIGGSAGIGPQDAGMCSGAQCAQDGGNGLAMPGSDAGDVCAAGGCDAAVAEPPSGGDACNRTCASDSCDYTCTHCDCSFDCGQSSETCELDCSAGSACALDCKSTGECELTCEDATCDLECANTESCKINCRGDSDCHVACGSAGKCKDVHCDGGARCLLECQGVSECEFNSCRGGSGVTQCPGDVIVCNRDCPEGASSERDEEEDD